MKTFFRYSVISAITVTVFFLENEYENGIRDTG